MKLGYLLLLVLLFPFAAKAQLKGQNCISVEFSSSNSFRKG